MTTYPMTAIEIAFPVHKTAQAMAELRAVEEFEKMFKTK